MALCCCCYGNTLVLMLVSFAFADTRQRTNLFFSQPLYGQVRSNAGSAWDNLGGLKFMETKHPPVHPTKTASPDELHFSALQISTSVAAHTGHHHDLDGFMAFKGTSTKVLNQGTSPVYRSITEPEKIKQETLSAFKKKLNHIEPLQFVKEKLHRWSLALLYYSNDYSPVSTAF
jgi:hypothetical protein